MEIIKGLYLNTDKIIIGKEYKIIYKYNEEKRQDEINLNDNRYKKYIEEGERRCLYQSQEGDVTSKMVGYRCKGQLSFSFF